MDHKQAGRAWSLSPLLAEATSIVCMGSMGAMAAASAGAAAGGMAGMGAAATGAVGHDAVTTALLPQVGLGGLTGIPDAVLRPLLVVLLALGIGGTYLAYRTHRQGGPLLLTIGASILLYSGIYVVVADPLYYLGLGLLLAGILWNAVVTAGRRAQAARPGAPSR